MTLDDLHHGFAAGPPRVAPAGPGSATLEPAPTDREAALRRDLREQVRRYCPALVRDRLEDIVQVAWLRLADAARKNERNRDPGPSLIARVAYCASIDEVRRCSRRMEVPVESIQEMLPAAGPAPDQATRAAEIGRAIRTCLVRLLPNRKRAVTLYLLGHTGPEIGAILRWPLKRAENMIFRGLGDLRRCLARKGIVP